MKAWMLLSAAVAVAAVAAACGEDVGPSVFDSGVGDDGGVSDATTADDNPFGGDDGNFDPDAEALSIAPVDATVNVTHGQAPPTLTYQAMLGNQPVSPAWTIDRGEIGSINVSTGVFTPKGTLGGTATIKATYKNKTATTTVTVVLDWTQNGDPNAGDAGGGAGGAGGVGGEGAGAAVDNTTLTVLQGNPVADSGLAWLYPYDKTVWPRGVLAPLMQWNVGAQGDYDAVYIHAYEKALDYKGYFAKTATPFIHHPIPQDVWKALGYSNAGEDLTVDLVFAKGNTAYGPITEKWKVAGGTLKGVVYYNSYGTNLAQNYCCTKNGAKFGGATLGIHGGDTSPTLVAGDNTKCRVCHSVAADGSGLVTEDGSGYSHSIYVDLKNANAETGMNPADGRFAWPGIFPDGSMLFSNAAPLSGLSAAASALFALPGGGAVASTGLPSGLRAGTPAFSPDGKHVAYNFYGGNGSDQKSLAAMDFDSKTTTFSNAATLVTPQSGKAWWPSFLPTNDAVVYELETVNNGRDTAGTRSSCDSSNSCSNDGTHAELWWVDLKTQTATRLDNANGKGYVPTANNNHADDSTLNYEPTVNPVPSGGYAWVVFTSRRLYGNVATINPYWSDPRFHDISQTPTTKKLWVAAIDLNAAPGTDPSHPAFYLPAQELLAGNSRGFWVVDPCKQDGNSCETGDECCGGYCQPDGDGGLTCNSVPPTCAQEFDKCTTDADCCGNGTLVCINGRCAQKSPN